MHLCFTDLSAAAAWRNTFCSSPPWETVPYYGSLVGFHIAMIFPDLLHVWNLGVARDAAGSILKKILQQREIFDGSNLDERLQQATVSLRAYARSHSYDLRMKRLTRNKLNWGTKKYPELMASGSDTHIVRNWLEELLVPYSGNSPEMCAYCTLLWSGNRCLRVLYNAGWFLDDEEKTNVRILGGLYAQTFICLAWESVTSHTLYFRVKPKLHLFMHVVEHPRHVNGSRYSTWMDEDFLKKVSKTISLTSSATAQVRVLQRWLMNIPDNLVRAQR